MAFCTLYLLKVKVIIEGTVNVKKVKVTARELINGH